jgi:hypothetical protein
MYFWWFTDLYNPAAINQWAASSAEPPAARERRSADERLLDTVAESLLADVWTVPGVTDVCDALRVTGRRYLAD